MHSLDTGTRYYPCVVFILDLLTCEGGTEDIPEIKKAIYEKWLDLLISSRMTFAFLHKNQN